MPCFSTPGGDDIENLEPLSSLFSSMPPTFYSSDTIENLLLFGTKSSLKLVSCFFRLSYSSFSFSVGRPMAPPTVAIGSSTLSYLVSEYF